jgi:predicted transcriptional regulator
MDYLKFKLTKKILEKIASKNGELTWYNIVNSVDQMDDLEKNLPSYYILDELTHIGFLEEKKIEEGKFPRYILTELGRSFLNQ